MKIILIAILLGTILGLCVYFFEIKLGFVFEIRKLDFKIEFWIGQK